MTTPTNTRSQGGAETLLPCPFCGAGESRIDHQNMWTGMRNQLVCVHIRHWCEKPSRSHLCITANTEEEAVTEWNTRALAAPASAQEADSAVRHALKQIVEADDAHALTQQLIEIGRAALAATTPPSAAVQQGEVLTDAQLGAIAYKGFDDYWTEDSNGNDSEAWEASAKAVRAALASAQPKTGEAS